MNIQVIVFLMMTILGGLLLWAKFYAPRERAKSKLEAEVYEGLMNWQANGGSLDQKLIEKAKIYFKNSELTEESLKSIFKK